MLQRSIIQPITGTIMALTMPPTESANEAVPRCQPISAMIGFKNTPKVKARTGPLQTNKPVTAPPTTHQGLLNLMPKMSSDGAAGFATRVDGHPIVSRSAGPMARGVTLRMLLVASRPAYSAGQQTERDGGTWISD